jgi:putative heme-binding domain-containing protein
MAFGFGPNLEFLKKQKDPQHILESLLKPSAKIKEGFATQVILTTDGRMLTGILKNETGDAVLLNQPNGETYLVPRDQIDERFTQEVSAMPAFDRMLNPQQAADLANFLLGK